MYRPRFVSASILISLAAITVGSGCGGGNATHRALKEGWYTYGDARTVDPMFWDLAETIVDGSDSVYGLIDAAAAHDQAQTTEAAGRKQAHIARVVEDDKIGRALGKQARYVANKCHASPGQQFTRKELQQATKGKVNGVSRKDVGGLDAIIKQALDLDWVTEKGGRYSSGTDRP